MIRLLHTADIHIGMENYGRIDPATGIHTRLLDFQQALHQCIDHALKDEVDVFLFAGDAYKTAHPTPTHQRILCDALLRLVRAHIPIVMVVGNHDHPFHIGKTHALDIFRQMPLESICVIDRPEKRMIMTKQGPIQIVGIPWPSRAMVQTRSEMMYATQEHMTERISDAVASIIQDLAKQCDPTIPAVLMGHLTVSTGVFSGSEKRAIYGSDPVLMPSQLACAPFDYVALGHLHRYQNLNPHGYPAVVYSGSLERIDFGERKEQKGFCRIDIPAKGQAVHTFHPVRTRPCIQIEVTLDAHELGTDHILKEIARHDVSGALVKIVYHVPAGIKDRVDKQAILHACAHAHYVVGVIPVYAQPLRVGRAIMAPSMTLLDRVRMYAQMQGVAPEQIERLLAKTEQLVQSHTQDII